MSSIPFITGQTLGTLRNNFTGVVGCKFTPGNGAIIITDLGRWVVAGNSHQHTITIYNGGVLASVTVDCSGATPGAYLYGALSSPFVALHGTGYFLESSETNGQDQWYGSDTVVTPTSAAVVNGSASTHALDGAGTNHSHGPENFKYAYPADWTSLMGYYGKKVGSFGSPSLLPIAIRRINLGSEYQIIGGEDATQGDPATPCIRLDNQGRFRFRWKMASGTRTISINVKQAINISPRPTLIVKANPDIGINSDQSATAGAGTGWVTIGPITVNPSSDGAVWVEVWNNLITQMRGTPCYVDHAVRT